MKNTEENPNSIKVLSKALRVIELLAQQKAGMSLGMLAKQLDMPRSTVQRIIDSLEQEGWVQKGEQDASLALGFKFLQIGMIAKSFDTLDFLKKLVADVHASTRETVVCARLDGKRIHFVVSVESSELLRAGAIPPDQIPLFQSTLGKVLLANFSPKEQKEWMKAAQIPTAEIQALLNEFAEIKIKGVAYDREECAPGICSVGVPLPRWGDAELVLAIVSPAPRYYSNEARYERELRQAAARLVTPAAIPSKTAVPPEG